MKKGETWRNLSLDVWLKLIHTMFSSDKWQMSFLSFQKKRKVNLTDILRFSASNSKRNTRFYCWSRWLQKKCSHSINILKYSWQYWLNTKNRGSYKHTVGLVQSKVYVNRTNALIFIKNQLRAAINCSINSCLTAATTSCITRHI